MSDRMSKITFRADDDLVDRLEEYDASKSEVMRKALREYLDGSGSSPASDGDGTLDELVRERVDEVVEKRVDALIAERTGAYTRSDAQDINVNISLNGEERLSDEDAGDVTERPAPERKTPPDPGSDASDAASEERKQCGQCGENLSPSAVYCSNCGEKATHRVFCDCGDELRSDWAFCPGCGRRTPAADVLDRS